MEEMKKQEVVRGIIRLFSFNYAFSTRYDKDHIENTLSNSTSINVCVFVAAGKCLPSRCIATLVDKGPQI
jgi:hypothetical protein